MEKKIEKKKLKKKERKSESLKIPLKMKLESFSFFEKKKLCVNIKTGSVPTP